MARRFHQANSLRACSEQSLCTLDWSAAMAATTAHADERVLFEHMLMLSPEFT